MRTIVCRYCAVPAFARRAIHGHPLFCFSSSLHRNACLCTRAPLQVHFSPLRPFSWSSNRSFTRSVAEDCSIIKEQEKLDPTVEHDVGFSQFLNAHTTDEGSFDVDKSAGDEYDHDEHGYAEAGSSHIPVLLSEVLTAFQDVQLHTFVDCTLGAGGHASSIILSHPELKNFVGLDVDSVAHSEATSRLQEAMEYRMKSSTEFSDLKLHMLKVNFKNIKNALHKLGLECGEVDGILMDLGMSSMQLNMAERGFSLQLDGPVDMRMDPMASTTASDVLNNWPESEIGRILREYGEERQWRRLAKRISEAQRLGGIHSTSDLLQLIQKSLPSRFSQGRAGWKKTAIRVFQALRIAVNDELSSLKLALPDAFECLKPGGCLAVISFHSLEDRVVKQFFLKVMGEPVVNKLSKFRESKFKPSTLSRMEGLGGESKTRELKVLEGKHAFILTKRPMTASLDEVKSNPRARSAKLRLLLKK